MNGHGQSTMATDRKIFGKSAKCLWTQTFMGVTKFSWSWRFMGPNYHGVRLRGLNLQWSRFSGEVNPEGIFIGCEGVYAKWTSA